MAELPDTDFFHTIHIVCQGVEKPYVKQYPDKTAAQAAINQLKAANGTIDDFGGWHIKVDKVVAFKIVRVKKPKPPAEPPPE